MGPGQTTTVTITTTAMPDRSVASTNGSQIIVETARSFPTAVLSQCSDGFDSNINDEINLFMGQGCSPTTPRWRRASTAART